MPSDEASSVPAEGQPEPAVQSVSGASDIPARVSDTRTTGDLLERLRGANGSILRYVINRFRVPSEYYSVEPRCDGVYVWACQDGERVLRMHAYLDELGVL